MYTLASPWLLVLLPLPLLMQLFKSQHKHSYPSALKVPFFSVLANATQTEYSSKKMTKIKYLLPWLIWSLLVLAAAGPEWLGAPINLPRVGRNIMLAVDLSGSMQIPDMILAGTAVDRLAVVKETASQFINERKGDRVGLILFGSKAYLQTPLTFDRNTVLQMLNDATIGLAGIQTAIGDAMGLAIKSLVNTPPQGRVLVLLTDGGNNSGTIDPIDAAQMAAKLGIRVYTIGLGATRLVVQGLFGPEVINPTSDLDETSLKEIANITHGSFFRAENTEDLENIYNSIDQLEPVNTDSSSFRPVKPLYPIPLSIALLLSAYIALKQIDKTRLRSFLAKTFKRSSNAMA